MTDSFYLGAYWKNRRLTMREYIAASKQYLAELQALHPVFRELVSWGNTADSAVVLRPDLSNLDDLILSRSYSKDAIYSRPRPDGGPTLESDCSRGFISNYSNNRDPRDGKVQVMITAGSFSPWLSNAVVINLPTMRFPEFLEYGFVHRLLALSVKCWLPQMSVVSSNEFRDKLGGEGGRKTIGWLTWFADPAVREALPAGVESELLGNGVLVTTTRAVLSADYPAQVETASRIRSALQSKGLLK